MGESEAKGGGARRETSEQREKEGLGGNALSRYCSKSATASRSFSSSSGSYAAEDFPFSVKTR